MKLLGLHPEWAIFRDMWRDLIWGKRLKNVNVTDTILWQGHYDRVMQLN